MKYQLAVHPDARGSVREVYRASWFGGPHQEPVPPIVQVVDSKSGPNVLRAMHSHRVQYDLWHFAEGEAFVQTWSPTQGLWTGWVDAGTTLIIPPGVAHGFYTPEGCTLIYLLTQEYTGKDELEFDALDPAYEGADLWPFADYVRSDRDRNARSFNEWKALVAA